MADEEVPQIVCAIWEVVHDVECVLWLGCGIRAIGIKEKASREEKPRSVIQGEDHDFFAANVGIIRGHTIEFICGGKRSTKVHRETDRPGIQSAVAVGIEINHSVRIIAAIQREVELQAAVIGPIIIGIGTERRQCSWLLICIGALSEAFTELLPQSPRGQSKSGMMCSFFLS